MVTLFKVQNWKLIINQEELLKHKEFSSLLDYEYNNRDKQKKRAMSELKYISLMYGYSSSIREKNEKDRHKEALEMSELPPNYKISSEFQKAIDRYVSLRNDNIQLKLLFQTENTINAMIDFLATGNDDIKSLDMRPDEVLKYISGLKTGIKTLQDLRKDVEESLKDKERIYGDAEKGLLEDPDAELD